jgi:Holliday junction resolvase-like predicted endonuclease
MEAVQTQAEKPSFETVWAALQEVAAMQRETDRQMKEGAEEYKRWKEESDENYEQRKKESDEEFKQWKKETDRILQNNARIVGKLGGRFGEMVEYMVAQNLLKKFRKLGFVFNKAHQRTVIEDPENNIFTEVDMTLENGNKVMIVEVKSKPSTEDVAEHIERMRKVRTHADLYGDRRKFLGDVYNYRA